MAAEAMLAPNFALEEARCHNGVHVPPELIPVAKDVANTILQPLRDEWGGPLIVISWYRTPDYNRMVGGADLSTHVSAGGVDIRPTEIAKVGELHELALKMHREGRIRLGGLGVYPKWIHVDNRRRGALRQWGGSWFGSEPGSP